MCEKESTSVEHAPPRCIFPEQKDLQPGENYRVNLITVPSCDEHNTQKSKEDEYLLYILPSTVGVNEVGLNQFLTKVQRAIVRKPSLGSQLANNPIPVKIHDTKTNILSDAVALEIDIGRIQDALEKTARAIYFHHTNKKHMGSLNVVGNFSLNLQNILLNEQSAALFEMADVLLESQQYYGDNQKVFKYRFVETGKIGILDLTFYGSNRALAVMNYG
ncbi:hypothetical protein ACQE3E_21910 [Methylomonas sp. MED-D]|uniref:hypothetical protein n=1 Tax=Methylomonas sp. MED-D TaxID=3418768 RepID=UPI003D0573B0